MTQKTSEVIVGKMQIYTGEMIEVRCSGPDGLCCGKDCTAGSAWPYCQIKTAWGDDAD